MKKPYIFSYLILNVRVSGVPVTRQSMSMYAKRSARHKRTSGNIWNNTGEHILWYSYHHISSLSTILKTIIDIVAFYIKQLNREFLWLMLLL